MYGTILVTIIGWYLMCAGGYVHLPDHACVQTPAQATKFNSQAEAASAAQSGERVARMVQTGH